MHAAIWRYLIPVFLLTALASQSAHGQALANRSSSAGTTYLLAIGVCPPYRIHIPVEICRNAVKAVTDTFPDALGIDKSNVISMTDAETTGPKVLAQLTELSKTLSVGDRLIVYVLLHGDAFDLWADYYQSTLATGDKSTREAIAAVNEDYFANSEDVMVFWTESAPTVPALALAEKDWLTVAEFVGALDEIPGNVAFLLDSCSSNRYFSSFHEQTKTKPKVDFVVASAGSEQISLFNEARTLPLFTSQLRDALNLPTVKTFGQAVTHAQVTTVQHATALCSVMTIPAKVYPSMFPHLSVPDQQTHDGQVSPPLWHCAQVPVAVDYTRDMASRALYGANR